MFYISIILIVSIVVLALITGYKTGRREGWKDGYNKGYWDGINNKPKEVGQIIEKKYGALEAEYLKEI